MGIIGGPIGSTHGIVEEFLALPLPAMRARGPNSCFRTFPGLSVSTLAEESARPGRTKKERELQASRSKVQLANACEFGRTLTMTLVDAVGGAIVRGEFSDKPFPTEAELSKEHGISRSITREAVKMITAKGLLAARPRVGTFVQPEENWNLFDIDVLRWIMEQKLSPGLLRQFNELRLTVEPQAAAYAARRASPAQVTSILTSLNRMHAAAEGDGDPLSADIDFHVAILRASGNPFLAQFRDVVSTALQTSIRITNRQAGGRACIPDHQAVYEAIAAGDPSAASMAMMKLIGDVLDYLDRSRTGLLA